MHRCSLARRFFAARLLAVAAVCFSAGYPPVQLLAGQADSSVATVEADASDARHFFRRYQATAYVTIFSVNMFTRSGVGFGYARADERNSAEQRDISLQFLSGSIPERAHGLNRFGFIQENIREHEHIPSEADYFGLITANDEESISQAKAALESTSGTVPFIAAEASIDSHSARYSIRHLMLSSQYQGADAAKLLGEVRASFGHPEEGQPEHVQPLHGDAMGTFLYSVREAMQVPSDKVEKRFIYNGKMFTMIVQKRRDNKAAQELQSARLVANAASVTEFLGAIRNEKTNEVTNFKLWFDRASQDLLPLRFEFRPRSFLRLVFQAEPNVQAPVTQALLKGL